MPLLEPQIAAKIRGLVEHPTVRWAILLAASFLLLFAGANQAGISADALIYSGEARAMADSGDYLSLRFGAEPNHHGPLLFWLSALAIKILGPTTFAATLTSRLFAFGCVILTGWLGAYLFGEAIGWMAALALTTTYTFLHYSTTLRMDSALTFGVLLSLVGYFRGERSWGPPLFYGGTAVAILAKAYGGFLPLLLAPLHSMFASNLCWPWEKPARRWLAWAPLLLVPLAWWGYLYVRYGLEIFSRIFTDLSAPNDAPRVSQFFQVFVLDFIVVYWPWLPFAIVGTKILMTRLLHADKNSEDRAVSGLLLGWVAVVLIASGLKNTQYQRYLMPALPAISIISAVSSVRFLKNRIPPWIPEIGGVLTIVASITLTFLPASVENNNAKLAVIAEVFNRRLPLHNPVPIIALRTNAAGKPSVRAGDMGRCRFFFGREARPTTIAEARELARRGHIVVIVPKADYQAVASELKLNPLLATAEFVLVEAGSGEEVFFPAQLDVTNSHCPWLECPPVTFGPVK